MFSVFVLILVASVSEVFSTGSSTTLPRVVVLSFDGVNYKSISKEKTPNLFNLRPLSAQPCHMKSVFPTKTFVTHFSASTGLYPKAHGVIGNTMFNADGAKIFNTREQFQTDKSIVPIWIENQKSGKHSAVMMWPGSEFEYDGEKPSHIQEYKTEMEWNDRVNKIIEWVKDKNKPANLIMAYFEDSPSHDKTIRHEEAENHIKKVDDTIKLIYDKLAAEKLEENLDMVIISDHGTSHVMYGNVLIVEDYVPAAVDIIASGPVVYLRPKPEKYNEVYNSIKAKDGHGKKFTVYKPEDIPSDWNLKETNNLKGLILLLAKSEYTFYPRAEFESMTKGIDHGSFVLEENGYDANDDKMKAFFVGIGPRFKDHELTSEFIEITDVYPILKHLLGLQSDKASEAQSAITLKANAKLLLENSVYT